jgi:hypothetical protein
LALAVLLAQITTLRAVMVAIQYFQPLHQLVVAEVALVLQIAMAALEALEAGALALALILLAWELLGRVMMAAQEILAPHMEAVEVAVQARLVEVLLALHLVTEVLALQRLTEALILVVAVLEVVHKAQHPVLEALEAAVMAALEIVRCKHKMVEPTQAAALVVTVMVGLIPTDKVAALVLSLFVM